MKLSHSAKEMYLTCPKKWQLHYQERLRSTKIGSALMFGSSIDEALNRMLLDKKKDLVEEELTLMSFTPEEIFKSKFEKVRVADEYIDITKSDQAMYYKSDLDVTLLSIENYTSIIDFAREIDLNIENVGDVTSFIDEAQIEMKRGLDEPTQKVYNYICWLALYNKGLMLIEAYRSQVMPQIEEVFDVQKRISLPDGGDEFIGVIDLICSFNSEPGVRYVCDNKTSSQAYKQDSVSTSEQLAGYSEHEEIRNCAYIIVEKKIRKREPRTRSNIIKDTMPEATIDETFDKVTSVLNNINEENFEKNFDSCFQYGRKCDYFDYCRTGSLKNLKYIKPKEKQDGSKDESTTRGTSTESQGETEGLEQGI